MAGLCGSRGLIRGCHVVPPRNDRETRLNSIGGLLHLRFMGLIAGVRKHWVGWVLLGSIAFALIGCGRDLVPLEGRADIPQPTFVAVEVTSAPESPTATPWPFLGDDELRAIPDGLDLELFAPASYEEVVNLWTSFLSGTVMQACSNRLYFRGRGRFEGELHMCPGGTGYFEGEPDGTAGWSVSTSVGSWYEVALTHEVPDRTEAVSFVLGIEDGLPVRAGSTDRMEFTRSDYCSNADPGVELPSFTADERRFGERRSVVSAAIADIPWVDGARELPAELRAGSVLDLAPDESVDYWNAFLAGGVVNAVAYDYGTFVLTEAFVGSLHMCDGRVAVLEGSPSGIGEWAVQSTGSSGFDAKILFTLPGDRTFSTLVLGVTVDDPVLMGRDEDTGLIAPSPLVLRESDECS